MSDPFIAQFPGACDECDVRIMPGQAARYNDRDKLVHANHRNKPEVVCTECFMVKPCECDDL